MPTGRTAVAVLFVAVVAAPSAPGVERKDLERYEEQFLGKWVEKVAKVFRTERMRLRAELEFVFPGRVADALTEEEYAGWFDLLAGRNDQWWRDDAATPQLGELFDRVAQRLDLGPVPSLTRDEFAKYAKRVLVPQNPPPPDKMPNPDEDADKVFRVLDRNGDAELEDGELTTDLADNKLFADLDEDGRVSRHEYRSAFRQRAVAKALTALAKTGEAPRGLAADLPPAKNRDNLPEWFARLDTDRDGQLSLFECRTGGGSVALFADMDLNGDGYLTRDEYRRYAKAKEAEAPKPAPMTRSRW